MQEKKLRKIFESKIFHCCKIPIASIYSSYSSLYIPLKPFSLPCMIYLYELFFPTWTSYASSSSQSCLYMLVIPPYMIHLCVLCFTIWSNYTSYSLRETFWEPFFCRKCFIVSKSLPQKQVCKKKILKENFGRIIFIVAKSFPRKQVCKKKNWEKYFGRKFFIVAKPDSIYLFKLFFPIYSS